MNTSDTTRHTIVNTGLICSLGAFALCLLAWLASAVGLVKQSALHFRVFGGFVEDPPVHFTLDLLLSLVGGLITGLVIGVIAKMLTRPKGQLV